MCVCGGGGGGGGGGGRGEAAAPSFEESQVNDTTVCLNQGSYINLAVSGGSKVLNEGNIGFCHNNETILHNAHTHNETSFI